MADPVASPSTRPGTMPPNYREVLYWRVPRGGWQFLVANLLAFLQAAAFGIFFFWFAVRFGGLRGIETGAAAWLKLSLGVVVTLVLHELAHGAVMQVFGARPSTASCGARWPSTPLRPVTRSPATNIWG